MSKHDLSRRHVLVAAGAGALAVAGFAGSAAAITPVAEEAIKKAVGGAKLQEGKVTVKLPQIAENGNTVPFTVSVESPMTDKDYVKAIHVFAEGNPTPSVASFHFTPKSGKAEVSMRMRLAKTQDIRAVAVMSDGSVYTGAQEVKVTIGGCGG